MYWCQAYPGLRIPEHSIQPSQSGVYKGNNHKVTFGLNTSSRFSNANKLLSNEAETAVRN